MYLIFSYDIPHRLPPFDRNVAKIFIDEQTLKSRFGFKCNFQYFSFTIRICSKPNNPRSRFSLGQIILFVTSHTGHGKTLDIMKTVFPVTIYDIIDGSGIVFLEYIDIQHIFSDKHFLAYPNDLILAVFIKDNYIIYIRTITNKLVFLESGSHKALLTVDIQFFICFDYLSGFDRIETPDYRPPRIILSIFTLQCFIPANRIIYDMSQMILYLFDIRLYRSNLLFSFLGVKFKDTSHFYLHKL